MKKEYRTPDLYNINNSASLKSNVFPAAVAGAAVGGAVSKMVTSALESRVNFDLFNINFIKRVETVYE